MLSCSVQKRSKVRLYFVYIDNESSDESLHAHIQMGKGVRTPTADGEGSPDPPLQMGKGVLIPTENHKWLSIVVLRNIAMDPRTPRAQMFLEGGPYGPFLITLMTEKMLSGPNWQTFSGSAHVVHLHRLT